MRVLLPIDEEPYTKAQLDFVKSYSWPEDTEIIVMHVMHSVMIERTMVSSQIYIDQIMKDARKLASKAADACIETIQKSCPQLKVKKELKEGDAIREIIGFAEKSKVDMIVMGSHGREGIGRVVLGSVAYSVLAKAPCKTIILGLPHVEKEYDEYWNQSPVALKLQ